jgi:hypothetical protein
MSNTKKKWYNNTPTLIALVTGFVSTALSLANVLMAIGK